MAIQDTSFVGLDNLVLSLQTRINTSLMRAIGRDVKDVALLDFPHHANVGDSAIWLGEVAFLRSNGLRSVYGCDHVKYDAKKLAQAIGTGPILLHGGGNFGDVWPIYQAFRHNVIERFPDNPIVQLPQTLHFSDLSGVNATRRLIERHPNFKLFVRDANSLMFAREHFPSSRPELCPDAAFMLGRLASPVSVTHDIVFLRRTDKERRTDWQIDIDEASAPHDVEVVDWLEEPRHPLLRLPGTIRRVANLSSGSHFFFEASWNAAAERVAMMRLRRGLAILGRGRTVVTDRLHAHILSTLLGRPHVVLDNNYGKLTHFIDAWTSEWAQCRVAPDPVTAIANAVEFVGAARLHA